VQTPTTSPSADRLRILADQMSLVGPELLAELFPPLTAEQRELVRAGLERHAGDPVAALGVQLPDDCAAIVRALNVGEGL